MSSSTWSSESASILLLGLFVEEFAGLECLADGVAEILHGLLAVELLEAGHGVLEAGVEQEVGEGLHQVFETEGGGEVAGELGVADALHSGPPTLSLDACERKPAGVQQITFA